MRLKEKLENLKHRNNFKIYFNGDDLYLDYWKYDEDDKCYHGILCGNIKVGKLTIEDIEKAIVDDNSYIKLEII